MTNRIAVLLTAATIGAYYFWSVRATGHGFHWGKEQNGYYNYLGRAFAAGQLHLQIDPAPELLALANPWDQSADERYKMHDMAFLKGRYYLYHGPTPALLLFTPWKLLTGSDFPERLALFVFCLGGFLFSSASLLRILRMADAKPGAPVLSAAVAALGICQSVPFLLSRVWLYEIAIGCGYFCLSAAFYFLVRGWLAAAGLAAGLAVACRPHLGLASLAVLILHRRKAAPFAAVFGLVCAGIALYNYARFGNPFEFGIRYLFTGPGQNRTRLAMEYIPHGFYHLLLNPPGFGPVFPFLRMAVREYSFPAGFFIESIVGALHIAPFMILGGIEWLRLERRAAETQRLTAPVRVWLGIPALSAGAIFCFLIATGWSTQRYEADFLPPAVLASIAALLISRRRSWLVLLVYGAAVSLAIGIAGPYDEFQRNRPEAYVNLARWFSPIQEHRPLLSPRISVELAPGPSPGILLRAGHLYQLRIEGETLISEAGVSQVGQPLPQIPSRIAVDFAPDTGRLSVAAKGRLILTHDLGALVTAPSQVRPGENVLVLRKSITP